MGNNNVNGHRYAGLRRLSWAVAVAGGLMAVIGEGQRNEANRAYDNRSSQNYSVSQVQTGTRQAGDINAQGSRGGKLELAGLALAAAGALGIAFTNRKI